MFIRYDMCKVSKSDIVPVEVVLRTQPHSYPQSDKQTGHSHWASSSQNSGRYLTLMTLHQLRTPGH